MLDFTGVLRQSRKKVYQSLMILTRTLKQQYDRLCTIMEQNPAFFPVTESDYRSIGMEPATGQAVFLREVRAAMELCRRTPAQLREADQGLPFPGRQVHCIDGGQK